jgi:hypothetical protein
MVRRMGHAGAGQRGLAQAKHRSGLVWFLLSLLLGPIATLCIVVMDDPRERFRS